MPGIFNGEENTTKRKPTPIFHMQVRWLVEVVEVDIHMKQSNGHTGFLLAARKGHTDIVCFLLGIWEGCCRGGWVVWLVY